MVMKTTVRGKAFVFGKNIDTDQIYPGRFVEYTDVEDIKKYAMSGADASFVKKFKPGDIIVAGNNIESSWCWSCTGRIFWQDIFP